MGMMASQITSLTIIYWTVYSGADQRKHQSLTSLAFVQVIHQGQLNSPHKWPVTQKMFPFDDVIMWCTYYNDVITQKHISPHWSFLWGVHGSQAPSSGGCLTQRASNVEISLFCLPEQVVEQSKFLLISNALKLMWCQCNFRTTFLLCNMGCFCPQISPNLYYQLRITYKSVLCFVLTTCLLPGSLFFQTKCSTTVGL